LAACRELLHWDHSPGETLRASNPIGWSCPPDMASVGLDLCKSTDDLELVSCKEELEEPCGMLRSVRCTLTDTGIFARRCKICNLDPEAEKVSLPGCASASVSSSGPPTPRGNSNSDLDHGKAASLPPSSRSPTDRGPVGNGHFSDDEVDGTAARCQLSATLMERPKFSDEDEYDPRKPEYIRPATVEEEMEAEVESLRKQIRSLKGMIHAREGREPDSAVLDFYRCIVEQMEMQIWHLEGKTYIVPSEDHDDMCDFYSHPTDLSTTDDSEERNGECL